MSVIGRYLSRVSLLQTAYHYRSLALYASPWFQIGATISTMLSEPIRDDILGRIVRPAVELDVETCDAICEAVPGHDRDSEVRDSTKQGTAKVVVHGERITGYTTGMSFYNHSVGLTSDDLKALIA